MSITLDLQPELEHDLLAQARAKGISLEDYVRQIVSREVQAGQASANPHEPKAANLVELFADSPFTGLDVEFPRDQDYGREFDL